MSYETITYKKEDGVAVVTLNRPEKMNAINRLMSREIMMAYNEAETDAEIGALVLTGGPDNFCAGADLSEVQDSDSGEPPIEPGMADKLRYMAKPTIAAIGGVCVAGGLEIAMSCDIRIASEESRIGDRHIRMGLIGPGGGVAVLPRLVGAAVCKELVFTGNMIDGKEAYRVGLVNHFYPKDKFIGEAVALAKKIAQNSVTALKLSKRAIDVGLQMNETEAMRFSEICSNEVRESAEFRENINKFMKK